MICVVDTNVPVVANGKSEQASPECVKNCVKRLEELKKSGIIVLDDQGKIFKEYRKNLRSEGQPGFGDAFLKWIYTNMYNRERCELVPITPRNSSETDFEEFPSDPKLKTFDPSDKKFVAVALAHSKHPPILQAVDRKWYLMKEALAKNNVKVDFLCLKDIQKK